MKPSAIWFTGIIIFAFGGVFASVQQIDNIYVMACAIGGAICLLSCIFCLDFESTQIKRKIR